MPQYVVGFLSSTCYILVVIKIKLEIYRTPAK